MAIHPTIISMLKESLPEIIYAADFCINYRKGQEWGSGQVGGCLGYPAALLLFSVVDAIGSYHRKNKNFKIKIDGEEKIIKEDGYQHFYILNSGYYGQNLSEEVMKKVYGNYRSMLTHNIVIPPDHFLRIGDLNDEAFEMKVIHDREYPFVNLVPFLKISKKAVKKFLENIESVVPRSKQLKGIQRRKW